MRVVGLDVGSRMIKLVVVENKRVAIKRWVDTTFDPISICRELLKEVPCGTLVATGYGRHLAREAFGAQVVPEILAHAAAAGHLFGDVGGVLDIGGQDTKAIALAPGGKVARFEMNDRCAAGTGKFLEVMAKAFCMEVEEFGAFALTGRNPPKISSMCAVFAESEATSLMARGIPREDIALGLHLTVARRTASMMRRVVGRGPVAFTGGVARNPCMPVLVERELGWEVRVPPEPHLCAAMGAALLCMDGGR